jgi:hypothetical protein
MIPYTLRHSAIWLCRLGTGSACISHSVDGPLPVTQNGPNQLDKREENHRIYAVNQGVNIHYQTEGAGPPLVAACVHRQPDDTVRTRLRLCTEADYRLILIDARAHHSSDELHEEAAYGAEQFAFDVMGAASEASSDGALTKDEYLRLNGLIWEG